ncbi:uncharacterized protein FOMMEDRAFT_19961 [Fomitiporia mediterranea MF3/22]|uniref:uncharacterized protein n=1 Tax=Fomitiporia mediterranea (strain MF3/22) TaxID=694068 RepID=UPI00044086EF|nr:uncharacterized protein FOMMEDRAFT_19961 [Fomitiporia mediterranea MF3/22]EJD02679.1 hypothetical protein FOMMEDRAFT_19961 [Fomitiporia mediterranea MF3/22]
MSVLVQGENWVLFASLAELLASFHSNSSARTDQTPGTIRPCGSVTYPLIALTVACDVSMTDERLRWDMTSRPREV